MARSFASEVGNPMLGWLLLAVALALLASLGLVVRQLKRKIQALGAELSRHKLVCDSSVAGIHILDQGGRLLYCNEAFARLLGYSAQELVGLPVEHWDTQASATPYPSPAGAPARRETVFQRKDGHMLEMEIVLRRVEMDGAACLHGEAIDVSERSRAAQRLKLVANVFDHTSEAIMVTDARGGIIEVNNAFVVITGYSRDEVRGCNPRFLKSGRQPEKYYANMWAQIAEHGTWSGEIWNRRKNGEVYVEMETISAIRDAKGDIQQYVAQFTDTTRLKEHEFQLQHVLHYDLLTKLPNRLLLADRMRQTLSHAKRTQQSVAVLCIDLDGFMEVNESYGHKAGDEVLIDAARRMLGCVRAEDTVARIGGDEFVILLGDMGSHASCQQSIARLLEELASPFKIDGGTQVRISGSVGYTMYPTDNSDADTLLRHAGHAMYSAKQAGKNRFHQFDVQRDTRSKANWSALAKIERGLERGEFVLYVQPKVSLSDGSVVGAEALIRWQHPVRGLVSPAEFLPLLDGQDLALKVGNWVIDQGMQMLSRWSAAGLTLPLSVNVDARQLREKDFSKQLTQILQRYPEVPPSQLEIEIVESAALDDIQSVIVLIEECRALGVRFALDDFGTGYSSLTYLKRLAVDTLKIDQSFVRDMLVDNDAMAIVRGVIGLAEAFQCHTVAEGVESWEQVASLKANHCEVAQGYVIARPMPSGEFSNWAKNFSMPSL
ncbi:MAG: EAL domain-containing protein [Rhodoferax sp.]|nr:EAL domain-containing protein [Rhodoferax sp.]